MIELKINVSEKEPKHFPLGRQGENRVRQIVFDVRPWIAKYGEGVVSLIAQRSGDAAPYPVAITVENGFAAWLVSNADTAMAGYGHAELRLTVGEAVKKSKIYTFGVQEALSPASAHPPQPQQGWVDQVIQVGAEAEQSAKDAAASESSAAASATLAQSWAVGGTNTRAGEDTDNAQYYAGQAATAASKAETAASNQPVIGNNGNWWVYDASLEAYRDTGYPARGTQGETGPQGPQGDDYVLTQTDKEDIAGMVSGMFVVQVTGTTPTIIAEANHRYICGTVATIDITPPASGICDAVFTSGSTAAVLTLPSTVKWVNDFDPTRLEANTTYELNIMDGIGVAVGVSA